VIIKQQEKKGLQEVGPFIFIFNTLPVSLKVPSRRRKPPLQRCHRHRNRNSPLHQSWPKVLHEATRLWKERPPPKKKKKILMTGWEVLSHIQEKGRVGNGSLSSALRVAPAAPLQSHTGASLWLGTQGRSICPCPRPSKLARSRRGEPVSSRALPRRQGEQSNRAQEPSPALPAAQRLPPPPPRDPQELGDEQAPPAPSPARRRAAAAAPAPSPAS